MKSNIFDQKRLKIILTITTTIIVTISIFAFLRFAKGELEETAINLLEDKIQQQQYEINADFSNVENEVRSMASSVQNCKYLGAERLMFLQEQSAILGFEDAYYVDIDGYGTSNSGVEKDFSEYLEERKAEEVIYTHTYESESTKSTVVSVIAPIQENEVTVAYVAGEYSLEMMKDRVEIDVYEGGYAVLVDEDEHAFFSTNNVEGYGFLAEYSDLLVQNGVNIEKISDEFINRREGWFTFDSEGEPYIGIYVPLEISDWMLVYVVNSNAITEINDVEILASIIIVTTTVIVLILVIIASNNLIRRKSAEQFVDYDELTGLPNYGKFKKDVVSVLKKNPDKRYAIVKFDIDNFKAINEEFDFETGNQAICAFAEVGKTISLESFHLGRVGSDEFIMFAGDDFFDKLEDMTYNQEILFKSFVPALQNYPLVFNYGRYFIEPKDREFNAIFEKVNLAHKVAKKNKDGIVCDYNKEYTNKIKRIAEITRKMELALENGEFIPYLQPKICLECEEIKGAEALVRWIEADGKMIYPDEFIPVFESNGFLIEVDKHMLRCVCNLIKTWIERGYKCIPISVNFSRIHLTNPEFINNLVQIVDEYKVPHEYIEVELTETTILDNESTLEKLFEDLHKANFPVAIDDFGAGYSSLGMLKNFNVDTLKLDRSFLMDNGEDRRGERVIEGVIKLAHSIGMNLVAEGVEDEKQVEFLRGLKCETAQGYYYSRPIPAQEFEEKYLK